jgi:hypothetical protein
MKVETASGNDQFASAANIGVASNSVRGASLGATREAGEPRHFNLSTSNSVWYTWRAPASGIVTFDTRGSAFDTVLAVYVGGAFPSLTELASDAELDNLPAQSAHLAMGFHETFRLVHFLKPLN